MQLCRLGEKKSKKVPKKVDKKSPVRYTVLARNANALPYIRSLLSGRACPPAAQLVWALLLSVILHGRKCRRIVCISYFTGVLYHDISSRYAGAGASVVRHAGEAGSEHERGSSACVPAKSERKGRTR